MKSSSVQAPGRSIEENISAMCKQINLSLKSPGQEIWLRAISLSSKKNRDDADCAIDQDIKKFDGLAYNFSEESPALALNRCKLVRISEFTISSSPDITIAPGLVEITDHCTESIADLWESAGYNYSFQDRMFVRQVIVEFIHSHGGRIPNSKRKLYSYPADKVFREDSPISPPVLETLAINKALQFGIWENSGVLSTDEQFELSSKALDLQGNEVSNNCMNLKKVLILAMESKLRQDLCCWMLIIRKSSFEF
jgi:hypothetical protein